MGVVRRYEVAIAAHVLHGGRYVIEEQTRIAPGVDPQHAAEIAVKEAHMRCSVRVPAWKSFVRESVRHARVARHFTAEEDRVMRGGRR